MEEGMRLLNLAMSAQATGEFMKAASYLDQAVEAAPRLGLAYVSRAQFYMMMGRYADADKDYTKGIPLIFEPDQPTMTLNTPGMFGTAPITVTPRQLAGDELIMHGYCLILMAEHITDYEAQKAVLVRAKGLINKGLKYEPDPERRELGKSMLAAFNF